MRARVSRWLLGRLERHTPELFLRLQLQVLLNATARGFGTDGKQIWRMPRDSALREYAGFTERHAASADADISRLYDSAFALGQRIRRLTGLTRHRDIQRLVFYLYRNIRITMQGSLPGEITVPSCYFSRFYAPERCRVMSAVDSGVIAGLFGGGSLVFTERITEGCEHCTAAFTERRNER